MVIVKKNMKLDVWEAVGVSKQCTFCIMGQQVYRRSKLNTTSGRCSESVLELR